MASGEMTSEQFSHFLETTLGHGAESCCDGAIAYVCMDWRHLGELNVAGRSVFSELKNLCIWNKTNGGIGSFYRSKHELIFVFKIGNAPNKQFWPRRDWAVSHECVGLCGRQQQADRSPWRPRDASDGQAGRLG